MRACVHTSIDGITGSYCGPRATEPSLLSLPICLHVVFECSRCLMLRIGIHRMLLLQRAISRLLLPESPSLGILSDSLLLRILLLVPRSRP